MGQFTWADLKINSLTALFEEFDDIILFELCRQTIRNKGYEFARIIDLWSSCLHSTKLMQVLLCSRLHA